MTLCDAIAILEDHAAHLEGTGRYEWGQDGASPPFYSPQRYAEALRMVLDLARVTCAVAS